MRLIQQGNTDGAIKPWYASDGLAPEKLPDNVLLSHAELREDILKGFIGGDFATDDFGEVVDAGAEVLTEEVGGEVGVKGILYADDVVE